MVSTSVVDEAAIRDQFCDGFEIIRRGSGFLLHTPFAYDDGDAVSLYVTPSTSGFFIVSDGGDVLMRLSYRLDPQALKTEMRRRLIESAYAAGEVTERNGVLSREVSFGELGAGVFGLTQAALRIMNVALVSQERVRSAFVEDLRQLVGKAVEGARPARERWYDPELDPQGLYRVDWRIETPTQPLFVFALTTTSHVKDATITLHQYDRWEVPHTAVGIAENLSGISKRSWAQFQAIADRAFPQLPAGRERIERYLRRHVAPPSAN